MLMSRHKRWAARVMIMALTVVNPVIALADMEVPALDVTAEAGQSEGINISENTENLQENSQNQGSPVVEAGSKELQEAVGEGAAAETPASPESTQGMTAENTAGVSESLPPSESMAADTSGSSPVMTAGSGSSPVIGPGTNAGPGAGPGVPSQNVPEQTIPNPADSTLTLERIDYFSEQVADPTVIPVEKYSYDTMVSDLEKLRSRYGSERLQINVIGTSLDGRNLYEAVLGNPNAGKHILIHAGIHAREYMTPLLVMKQLEYGLEFYDRGNYAGQPLSAILQQVAVHFVPMTNPDGTTISQFGIEGIRSEELRQVIRQCYADDTALGRTSSAFDRYLIYWKANARGVDLNHNFPANWDLTGSPPNPSYATYKGTQPFSEPETQALEKLVNSRKWSATISYHSMGNLIYWDYVGNRVQQASGELTALLEVCTQYRAASSPNSHGGFKDWTQIKDDPIPGVTIETGSVACPLPLSQFEDIWNRNKMVWALAARYAMDH